MLHNCKVNAVFRPHFMRQLLGAWNVILRGDPSGYAACAQDHSSIAIIITIWDNVSDAIVGVSGVSIGRYCRVGNSSANAVGTSSVVKLIWVC